MIPAELQALHQWVAVDMTPDPETGKPRKHPLNPRTMTLADVTNPATWGSFAEAIACGTPVGFVLSRFDPFTIIDFDNKEDDPATETDLIRQHKIIEALDSYTERSISGRGFHTIVRASVESGVRRDKIELYSDERFMICTGDVVLDRPIRDQQEAAVSLWEAMGGAEKKRAMEAMIAADRDEMLTDLEVYEMACSAVNGEKFMRLADGDFTGYPSPSEADLGLMSMLCYYSPNNEQCIRLFRMSGLAKLPGRAEKIARDEYVIATLRRARVALTPPVDIEAGRQAAAAILAQPKPAAQPPAPVSDWPPGLIGEIAQYIYASAQRPVKEVAIAAALAFIAGVAGRSFNISHSGLALYIVVLGGTGVGKEGGPSGINRLFSAIRKHIPSVDQFRGSGHYASSQALFKKMAEKPCCLSIFGEFGLTLQQWCSPKASAIDLGMRKILLDFYGKTGFEQTAHGMSYSDKEKDVEPVQAPNLTLLCDATPATFFEGLTPAHLADGFLPRFTLIEYQGDRPPTNAQAGFAPPEHLVMRLADLVTVAMSTQANSTVGHIAIDDAARAELHAFDQFCDDAIRSMPKSSPQREIWNRSHLKALKLAGVVAVGVNYHSPMVTLPMAQWAIQMVKTDATLFLRRFDTGEVGTPELKQENEIKRVMIDLLRRKVAELPADARMTAQMQKDGVVPLRAIHMRTANLQIFTGDPRGHRRALRETLAAMASIGAVNHITPQQAKERYKVGSDHYQLAEGVA